MKTVHGQVHGPVYGQVRVGETTPATPAMAGVKFRQLRLVPRLEFPPGTSLCTPRALLREKWQAVPAPAVVYLSLAIVLINLHHPSSFRNESLAMPSLCTRLFNRPGFRSGRGYTMTK